MQTAGALARSEAPRPRITLDFASATTSRIDDLLPGGAGSLGLTGAGVLIGEWDEAGARSTHEDLRRRVSLCDAAGAADHSTHVAGTLIGDGTGQAMARGMAPGAELLSYDWSYDWLELREHAPYLAVSNHAYGFRMGWAANPACSDRPSWMGRPDESEDRAFGKYGPEAAALDALTHETGLLTVWAGGNERQDVGAAGGQPHYHYSDCGETYTDAHAAEAELQYDTMGLQLAAKNSLVIGAADHVSNLPARPGDIAVLPFSSYGPMDDGRVKPDLVASGAEVFSTISSADDAYASYSGTSSSAAVVSGGLALLTEHYRKLHAGRDPRAEELKAVLVESAAPKGADGRPTYEAGYGLFDARSAADLLTDDAGLPGDQKRIRLGLASGGGSEELRTAELVAGSAVRITLCWTDPPAAPNEGGVDDPKPALVNDLDLVLVAPDGMTQFLPWSLSALDPSSSATRSGPNSVDNVEVLDVAASDNIWTGAWTVRVSANHALYRSKPQAFALASSVPLSAATAPVLGAPRSLLIEAEKGATPAPASLSLVNLGSGALAWSADEAVPWLTLDKTSGSTPDTLELRVDASGLATGTYFGSITIASDDASGPRALGITLRVTCTPDCSGRACGPDPKCGEPCGGCAANQSCDATGHCAGFATASACPTADLGSELGPLLVTGVTQGAGDHDRASCGGDGGEDLSFRWTAPEDGSYRFGTDGSAFDTVLYLRDGCGGRELACDDDSDDASSALSLAMTRGQSVIAVVDGKLGAGAFHFGVERASCPDADLGSRLGAGLARVSSQGSTDRVAASCGGAGVPESLLAWTAPEAGTYTFALEDPETDAVLYARASDCAGAELGCSRAADGAQLRLALAKADRVLLAIESGKGAEIGLAIRSDAGVCAGNCDGSPNHGACFCDVACTALHDCCADACALCGHCCVKACDAKECGDDGCGESCGSCPEGAVCDGSHCMPDPCAGKAAGAACDDGDPCTSDDRCVGGRCAGVALLCDDGDVCTRDRCDAQAGGCTSTPIGGCCARDAECDDDDACTDDRCAGGSCVHVASGGCPSQDAGRAARPRARPAKHAASTGCGCRVFSGGTPRAASSGFGVLLLIRIWVSRKRRRRSSVEGRRRALSA